MRVRSTANTTNTARNRTSKVLFVLVVAVAVAISALSTWGGRVVAQPVPTSLPTTIVVTTTVPTTIPTLHPTSVPTTIVTQTSVPAIATTVPTTVPTTIPTTKPTTVPTTIPTTVPTTVPTIVPGTLTPSPTPTVVPTQPPTPTPTPTVVPTAPPTTAPGTVWSANGGKYAVVSGSGQCGSPTVSGGTFSFALSQSSGSCYRNQAQPTYGGYSSAYLTEGATYQWSFTYRDSDANGAAPGMGPDADARSLVWQVHPNTCSCTPCTTLNFVNGPNGVSSPEYWGFYDCASGSTNVLKWSAPYVAGQTVNWKIEVTISKPQGTANGSDRVWMNGTLVYSADNVVTNCCATNTSPSSAWWNFGPYKWIWANATNASTMTKVNATFDNMTLTQMNGPSTVSGAATLQGCPIFPAADWIYQTPIDSVAADPDNAALMNSYLSYAGQSATLSLSYSSTYWFTNPANASVPQYPLVQIMPTGTPAPAGKPPIVDFPFTPDMPWQGKSVAYTGDRHITVLDTQRCIAFESYVSNVEPPATWQVVNNQLTQKSYYGGRWILNAPYPSPSPRTGVNLGGMPQFAGMVYWEDWLRGDINHALNINIKSHGFGGSVYPCISNLPMSYYNGTVTPPIPCGVHWRLKSSYVLNCTCPQAQMIVRAMKKYGLFMMDQGTPPGTIYLANYQQGDGTWIVPWDANDVKNIAAIPMSALEIVPPPGCTSVAACVKYSAKKTAPYGLNPGICALLPDWWKREHRLLYRRLCKQ